MPLLGWFRRLFVKSDSAWPSTQLLVPGPERRTPSNVLEPHASISESIPHTQTLVGDVINAQLEAWIFEERADFPTEVVGEAYRIEEVWKVRRSINPQHREYIFEAVLVPEPDNDHDENAVAVYAADYGHVGYIKRSQARLWGPLIQDFNRIARKAVACRGIIRGEYTLQIFLNIKLTDIQRELDRRKVSSG